MLASLLKIHSRTLYIFDTFLVDPPHTISVARSFSKARTVGYHVDRCVIIATFVTGPPGRTGLKTDRNASKAFSQEEQS